jgi:hypothetical protein
MNNEALLRATMALQAYRNALESNVDPRPTRTIFEQAIVDLRGTPKGEALWDLKLKYEEATTRNAFNEFGKLTASGFAGIGSAFELGQKMAQQGQKSLLFPTVASELTRVADVIKGLKEAADSLTAIDIQQLQNSFNKGDIAGLLGQANQVETLLQQLQTKLTAVKTDLPN